MLNKRKNSEQDAVRREERKEKLKHKSKKRSTAHPLTKPTRPLRNEP
jgi:hypothetical protein